MKELSVKQQLTISLLILSLSAGMFTCIKVMTAQMHQSMDALESETQSVKEKESHD